MEHLSHLRTLNFITAAYTLVVGLCSAILWIVLGIIAIGDGDPEGWYFVAGGVVVGLFASLLGVLHVVVGYLVRAQRGRVLQTVLAVFQVTSFPLGTCYAAYAMWVCWFGPSAKLFGSNQRKPPVT
ncbi:MAG: hypothetical protein AAGF12_13985 [Myxococcota bacterium]